jgi:GDPmannose 4,6-dehydratase
MSKKRVALITGISGQDGSYLAEHLLDLGYDVHGMLRRHSVAENQDSRICHLSKRLNTYYGDLSDGSSIEKVIKESQPDEIYNLGAMSHVRISADIPIYTVQINALGVANMLEAFRKFAPSAKFYQASSSEIFGNNFDEDKFQRETTPKDPVSVYGCSKLFSFNMVRYYRRAFGLFCSNGILHNHESPRRGSNFVTSKVVMGAVEISLGLTKTLTLGNMDSSRDWGHSYDYVRAMQMILSHKEPDDFTVATGEAHSVRELCDYVFGKLGMDYRKFVVQDPRLLRPEELNFLRGDSTKVRTILGWKPKYTFETLLDEMVEYWLGYYGKSGIQSSSKWTGAIRVK